MIKKYSKAKTKKTGLISKINGKPLYILLLFILLFKNQKSKVNENDMLTLTFPPSL